MNNEPGKAPSDAAPAAAGAEERPSDQATAEALPKLIEGLKFEIEKSIRYHHRRQGFFDGWHRWSMFWVIISGSAAFAQADIIDPALWGLVSAGLGASDLAFAWSQKARDHQALHKRFVDCLIALQSGEESEASFKARELDRLRIEADEHPTYYLLEADCWNEVAHAWGRTQKIPMSKWERLTCQWRRADGFKRPAI